MPKQLVKYEYVYFSCFNMDNKYFHFVIRGQMSESSIGGERGLINSLTLLIIPSNLKTRPVYFSLQSHSFYGHVANTIVELLLLRNL